MTTIVFPGQGSQYMGMSKDFFDNYSIVRETFELIQDISKINIKEIIFENPSDFLNQTQYTQLAIFSASISIYNVFKAEFDINKLQISCMLGHSLGEYTALTAANIITINDCVILLKKRGELMQNAFEPNKSGMAAIIGINCESVEKTIIQNNLEVQIANDNSPLQVVISGTKENLVYSEQFFISSGAKKFIFLNVSAAFHSNIMNKAENELNDFIKNIDFHKSSIEIVSNFTGKKSNDISIIIENLKKQMSSRVRWVESINTLTSMDEKKIIEIGPGKILTGLIKRINNNFMIKNIEYLSDLDKINNEF